METELIPGKHIPAGDKLLAVILGLWHSPSLSEKSIIRFGVENEDGEMYRIVGVNRTSIFEDFLSLLPKMHYYVRFSNSMEQNGLIAVIKKHDMVAERKDM